MCQIVTIFVTFAQKTLNHRRKIVIQRGRSGSSELAVVPTGPASAIARPEPPDELLPEAAAEWRAVVGRLPADWFPRETWPCLIQYCRHVVSAGRVAQMIHDMESNAEEFDLKKYDKLLAMQEREGRAMSSLATRMRLTQQSTFDKERKKDKQGKRPWQQ